MTIFLIIAMFFIYGGIATILAIPFIGETNFWLFGYFGYINFFVLLYPTYQLYIDSKKVQYKSLDFYLGWINFYIFLMLIFISFLGYENGGVLVDILYNAIGDIGIVLFLTVTPIFFIELILVQRTYLFSESYKDKKIEVVEKRERKKDNEEIDEEKKDETSKVKSIKVEEKEEKYTYSKEQIVEETTDFEPQIEDTNILFELNSKNKVEPKEEEIEPKKENIEVEEKNIEEKKEKKEEEKEKDREELIKKVEEVTVNKPKVIKIIKKEDDEPFFKVEDIQKKETKEEDKTLIVETKEEDKKGDKEKEIEDPIINEIIELETKMQETKDEEKEKEEDKPKIKIIKK